MKITFTVELPGDMSQQRIDRLGGIGDATVSSAFKEGFIDGIESPDELSSGMTYAKDRKLNAVYDEGVNLGQAIGRLFGAAEEYRPDLPGEDN